MARGEIAGKFLFRSTIYNVDLPTELIKQMTEKQWDFNSDGIYEVEILFGKEVYEIKDFYSFPLSVELPTGKERERRLQADILRQQRDNVVQALRMAGVAVWNAGIIAEGYAFNFVKIVLYKHERERGEGGIKSERGTDFVEPVYPISPSFRSSFLVKLFEDQMRKDEMAWKEWTQRAQHTPTGYPAEVLFSEIAHSMYPSDCDKANQHKEMLYKTATLMSDWPLQIKSSDKTGGSARIDKDAKLDCPEYIIYTHRTTGEWSIEKTENLKTAQQTIVKNGYNLKKTSRIVVLHNLKAVPYTLFKETDEGLVMVTPEEAQGQKNLHLSWEKRG